MNQKEFNNFWDKNYPESYPISHELKSVYPDRWLRIHSLPESKRYAETDDDYKIILERQNQLISDLIEENSKVIVSFGYYETELTKDSSSESTDFGKFQKNRTLELHIIRPEENEGNCFYDIYIKNETWKNGSKNEMLKAIADCQFSAMFIFPKENCIIAPYDGGMDLIVPNQKKRDELKAKYKDWLSDRKDGL